MDRRHRHPFPADRIPAASRDERSIATHERSRLRPAAIAAIGLLLMPLSCASPPRAGSRPGDRATQVDARGWAAPPLERAVVVRDGRSGEKLSLDEMLDRLARADAVFLGESHTDETTHRVEHAVYQGLIERLNGRVVLAMEMFERDVQPALDAYLAGGIDEATFLSRSRPWSNYRTGYRPMVETAREAGLPVVASNFPRPLRMKVAMEGAAAFESLEGEAAGHVPAQMHPNTAAYWRRVDNAIRGHRGMMGGTSESERLYSTQSLWDNSMGEACAMALDRHPGWSVLHVNGAFHSAYWDGTVHQLRLRKPDAKILTVAISPVINPAVAVPDRVPEADFVVFAEARATDVNEGKWSVYVSREHEYRLHVPKSATDDRRAPLVIWLNDEGLEASDGLDLWKDRLGDDVAIAVLEPLYPETGEDLSAGGRWFKPDSFSSDIGTLIGAIERVRGYVLRNFPVDPKRVCLAGEGDGATVVAAAGMLTGLSGWDAIAFEPSRYAKIKDFPLPLPEYRGGADGSDGKLRVIAGGGDGDWWKAELAEYVDVGLNAELSPPPDDAWQRETFAENALRQAVDAPLRDAPAASERRYIVASGDTPRARQWARLQALRVSAAEGVAVAVLDAPPDSGDATPIPTEIYAESFASPHALPKCPGPFGGTTVIVLPKDAAAQDVRAWEALAQDDPLNKESRFHRLRIAKDEEGSRLPDVLATLKSEGRENILIVPAAYCADAATMRDLRRSVRSLEDAMTLQWMPGLGGRDVPVATAIASSASPGSRTSPESPQRPGTEPQSPGIHAGSSGATPVHHTLVVALDPAQHHIRVENTVELPRTLSSAGVEFTLDAALTILSCDPAVTTTASDDENVKRYKLETAPPDGVVRIRYEGNVHHGLSDQKEEYTRGFRESRGILGPEGVYLHGESEWVPRFSDDLIRFDVTVTQPDDWHVIAQGDGTSHGDDGKAHWTSGTSVEQVYLVGGPLHVERDSAGAVEVLVYLHEVDEALSRKYLDATARYIEMYRKLIGPYPYGKFALVENFWETGYGMPSFTLLGPQIIRFPFILTSSYPHEILHNWWGNSVFVDYDSGNWCEGLTAYLADHLIQEQRGEGANYRRTALQKYRNYVQESRDFPLSEFHNRHSAATEAVGYGKSLMLFHMLRRQIGEDAFRGGLAELYRKQKGKRASFDDLRIAFERASDADLKAFFEQWVTRAGAPALALADVSVSPSGDGFKITGVIRQTQPADPFALSVPLFVQTDAGVETFTIETDERDRHFEITTGSRPSSIAADPMFDLFRTLDPREIPPSIGQLFGDPNILAILPAADADGYRALMEGWQSDDHRIEIVSESDVSALPSDRAVWVLGRDNRFVKDVLAAGGGAILDSKNSALTLAGESVPFGAHSTVVIQRHPANMEKAIGWITVDPPAALPGMGRKLPHYGKYSYLAFEGDEPTNVVKGQWEPDSSPMVVNLDKDRPLVASAFTQERKALAELPPVFSQSTLMSHVSWLASPERAGRGLGTPELAASADYIAQQFASAGLQPGGDDGTWLQKFTVESGPDGTPVEAFNVIGILPGKRAEWADQSVVLSAHYDHLGRGWPGVREGFEGQVHPGADDNATGVAVIIELARNLAAEGGGSRNLVVAAFSAEEAGRLGSRFYVEHPRFPLEGVRGVINLDTVGRLFDGQLAIHGNNTADEWQHIFRGCGFVTGVKNKIVPGGAEGSDQWSFIERGIPGVQLFTGAHLDYHRPGDTIDKVDGAGLVQVATFTKEAVTYMLEREAPLNVRIDLSAAGGSPDGSAAPAARASDPHAGAAGAHGAKTDPHAAAANPHGSSRDPHGAGADPHAGAAAPAPGTASNPHASGADPHGTTPPPAGAPAQGVTGERKVMFGVVPDFAFQGEGVRVDGLVPESPAAVAGVQEGDILLELAGETVEDLRGFSDILKTLEAGQEVEAIVVREGARLTMKVTVTAR